METPRIMRNLLARLFLLAFLISAPYTLFGQDSAAMIGTVTDATGAVVPGAKVVLTNKSTGLSFTQTTDRQGVYRFLNVPPNNGYSLEVSHAGFVSQKVQSLPLQVGVTRTLDEKLVAGSEATVTVETGSSISLDTTDASLGNNVDVKMLDKLPILDRTAGITTLFYLQAGVDYNSGAVTGARIDQSEVTVDGIDANDLASGQTFAIIPVAPVDSIEQFGATVAGMVPAVGTGSGGQFQMVTKSGANRWHGDINEYHRDTSTASNTYFNNLIGLPRTPLIRNQFGGNVGGAAIKNKLYFFFEIDDSRIVQSQTSEPIVPLSNLTQAAPTLAYINSGNGCSPSSRINTAATCITQLSAASVANLDPAHTGFDTNVLGFLGGRFPAANDLTQGDGVNTGGYRFTSPTPDNSSTYVAKVDYNLTSKQHVFARATVQRENSILQTPVLPNDPVTHPFINRSYGYVVSHIWTINSNMVNQFYYGDNISKFSFPNAYNPTGADQYSFSGLSNPYSGNNGQQRRVPIPEFRDDFNWQLGNHSLTAGGLFKFIKTNSNLINNFNFVAAGLQGSSLSGGLDAAVRPQYINPGGGAAYNDYDQMFATSLGVIGDISTNFNYTNKGTALPAGSGGPRAYRFFETEAYVGDTWKITQKLTATYGLRYQLYSVPYEAHGEESVEYTSAEDAQHDTINNYVNARLVQSAAGASSNTSLPIYSVELGGKANNGPNLYAPSYKDLAPRIGLAYHAAPNTVINGSVGIVYDRTVINAINFLQDQLSYLFSNSLTNQFGAATVDQSLATDTRLGANLAYPSTLNPVGAALTVPYTPYVDANGVPNGLAQGQTNFVISPNLKDPYSIAMNFGIEQQFNSHLLLKMSYAGRLGRRLLADADAGQVLDVPDYTHGSTQTMSQAFAGLTTQTRACQQQGIANCTITPQPWFENVLGNYKNILGSNTALVNAMVGQLAPRGDISDSLQAMANYTYNQGFTGFLPTNIGLPSQFGANAYLTNQGNSNYHALLVTLSQSSWHGLQYDFNYTWSHSIDNTSLSSNNNALFSNSGFICDITRPRACRGNSDFDVTHAISSDFIYDLPFGHDQEFLGHSSTLVNELVGGWAISGLVNFHSGLAVTPYSDAYLASFDNQDPAIFIGNSKGDLRSKVNVDHSTSTVYNFAGGQAGANKVLSEFRGPIGIEYGNRNLLRSPHYSAVDAGLAKSFGIWPAKDLNLVFRADAFNLLNHSSFGNPAVNIVNNQSTFGQITYTVGENTAPPLNYRVGQFSLRLEF